MYIILTHVKSQDKSHKTNVVEKMYHKRPISPSIKTVYLDS